MFDVCLYIGYGYFVCSPHFEPHLVEHPALVAALRGQIRPRLEELN